MLEVSDSQGTRYTASTIAARSNLSAKLPPMTGAFSPAQNRAILITGLSCACMSLVAAFTALRWFVLMRRCFRHQLVLFLIASDTFKVIWYFVFAVVAFSNGPVKSSSAFCQASGYLLLTAIEASDFAILMIALHAMLYIFMPISKTGEGGLYPYRSWTYLFWLGPPLLAASLAFVQGPEAYVTAGTYCFLPKRPIWYRLALGWVPRYLIFSTILVMYASIYIYVRIKFHSFRSLAQDDSSCGSGTRSRQSAVPEGAPQLSEKAPGLPEAPLSPPRPQFARPSALRMHSYNSLLGLGTKKQEEPEAAPWDAMSFITSKPLESTTTTTTTTTTNSGGVASEDFATRDRGSGSKDSDSTCIPFPSLRTERAHSVPNTVYHDSRKPSDVPTTRTSCTGDTATTITTTPPQPDPSTPNDPLRSTRIAIRRQLRFLFIYPLIYLLMWAFPFVCHILNYSDHYVAHPPFWLSVTMTCSLALQAGVDSVVFSLREKPWRNIDENSRLSIPFLHRRVSELVTGRSQGGSKRTSAQGSLEDRVRESEGQKGAFWWEAEGRKRKDSIWMGTDLLSRMTSTKERREEKRGLRRAREANERDRWEGSERGSQRSKERGV